MGQLGYQPYVFRYFQVVGHVSFSLIDQHQHQAVVKVLSDFFQKQTLHVGVCIGQKQAGHFAQDRTNCCLGIQIFSHDLSGRSRPNTFWSPTVERIADSAEASFVLSHNGYWPAVLGVSLCDALGYLFREFSLTLYSCPLFEMQTGVKVYLPLAAKVRIGPSWPLLSRLVPNW